MKKRTFLALGLSAISMAAFAQGKVRFLNDSQHYFVLGQVGGPADGPYSGGTSDTSENTPSGAPGAIPVSPLPSGTVLTAALYAGTNSSNLSLQYLSVLDSSGWASPGRMASKGVVLSGIPAGQPAYFQIFVYGDDWHTFSGHSPVFTAIPGFGITYPSLLPGGSSQSTWSNANIVTGYGPDPPLPYRIQSLTFQPQVGTTLVWNSWVIGCRYQVQRRNSLETGSWSNVGSYIIATNWSMSYTDTTAGGSVGFYRVLGY